MLNKSKYWVLGGISVFLFLFVISFKEGNKDNAFFNEKYRPKYHFSYPDRWMNDPTGMIYYKGKYHLNFRNASSPDLIYWDFSLKNKPRNDSVRMMSGCSVIDWNNTSGFGVNDEPPIVAIYSELRFRDNRQRQSIAYSNDGGFNFTAYEGNPVIDINSTEFRDPTVFWHEPSGKWVMAVALAAECKVRFYGSKNLKEWYFLSDFGPAGAREGVWECPDIFPLPVDNDSSNIKWVLEVDVQPVSGQYFIGEFDGEKFVMDNEFEKRIAYSDYTPAGKVLFDFENDLSDWEIVGEAFNESPANKELHMQSAILGKEGNQFINSFHNQDNSKGKLTSPEFTITHNFINFLIGGGNHPGKECVNLLINDKVVRTKTGFDTEALKWVGWDVGEFGGKKAKIEIVDGYDGGFGHITADHIMLCKEPVKNDWEKAPWIDYGLDFYAVRSWFNMPENDDRRIWLAWMSNWMYARDVPTEPWTGFQSFPRKVELKTFGDEVHLVQNPIEEIHKLRSNHFTLDDIRIVDMYVPKDLSISSNSYEVMAEFEIGDGTNAGLRICVGEYEETIIGYDAANEVLYLDRTNSGNTDFNSVFPQILKTKLKLHNKYLKLHVLVDQSSVEVFANNGERVISSLIFPDPQSRRLEVFSLNGNSKLQIFDLWELKSIWNSEMD